MSVDPPDLPPEQPRSPNQAQRDTYCRLFTRKRWSSAQLHPLLTIDGIAVAYFNLAGKRHVVHIGQEGQLVTFDQGQWVTIAGTSLDPQLTLGV